MEQERIIKNNLTVIGEDFDQISKNLKAHLFAIQEIVDREQAALQAAIKTLKNSTITVSSVCSELNISRNTAYRYSNLLQRYIDHSGELLASKNPLVIIDELKKENAELQRQLHLMADRDIDALASKLAVTQRDRLLQEKNRLLEEKSKRILELSRDCQQLRIALEQTNPGHRLLKLP